MSNESWPGQDAMIAEIRGREYAGKPTPFQLDQMTREELEAEHRQAWLTTKPHHAPRTRRPLQIEPVERHIPVIKPRALHELPAWAQGAAARARAGTVPAKRWRAVVWDSERCLTVHLGTFDSIEARDAAVQSAKDRRAIGLPLKPL